MAENQHPFEYDPNWIPREDEGVLHFEEILKHPPKLPWWWQDTSGSMPNPIDNTDVWEKWVQDNPTTAAMMARIKTIPFHKAREVLPRYLKPGEYTITEDPDTGRIEYHQGLPQPNTYNYEDIRED